MRRILVFCLTFVFAFSAASCSCDLFGVRPSATPQTVVIGSPVFTATPVAVSAPTPSPEPTEEPTEPPTTERPVASDKFLEQVVANAKEAVKSMSAAFEGKLSLDVEAREGRICVYIYKFTGSTDEAYLKSLKEYLESNSASYVDMANTLAGYGLQNAEVAIEIQDSMGKRLHYISFPAE